MWNPTQYQKFATERNRPFFDLLNRVEQQLGQQASQPAPQQIADLGCGPGNLTQHLAERWPSAQVSGVDSSPQMLATAMAYAGPNLRFVEADIRHWQPTVPLDLLVSSATLQWLDDHATVLPHLAAMLASGGVLALQMPSNFSAASHQMLAEVCQLPQWAAKLPMPVGGSVEAPEWYVKTLVELGFMVDAWETNYIHILHGENAVLEWVKGTALRPILAKLSTDEAALFLAEYGQRLSTAYPSQSWGTLLPFKRLFVVARKP
jgi:trans-aconitate 2-methyltransferase